MSDLSFYDFTIPPFLRQLDNLTAFLKKGQEWAKENNVPEEQLLSTRLYPDMEPIPPHIQRLSDSMKFAVVRLAKGVESVAMEDNEKSFADIFARIEKTRAFLEKVPRSAFDGLKGSDVIVWDAGSGERRLNALDYATGLALSKVIFHVTTTYALLRHQGVPVGIRDFLGAPPKDFK